MSYTAKANRRNPFNKIRRLESPPPILHHLVEGLVLVNPLLNDQDSPGWTKDAVYFTECLIRFWNVVQHQASNG